MIAGSIPGFLPSWPCSSCSFFMVTSILLSQIVTHTQNFPTSSSYRAGRAIFESLACSICCLKERDQLCHPSLILIADFTIPVSVDPFRVHAAGLTVADLCGILCTSQKGVLRLSNLKACKISHRSEEHT